MADFSEIFKLYAGEMGFQVGDELVEKFKLYMEQLLEWNQKMNLTAITDVEDVILKHFVDSLTLLLCADFRRNLSLIDIGTGAGFPGVPIKLFEPGVELTLLDSLNKRLLFLKELCKMLNIEAEIVHERAEIAGRDDEFREKFDIATSRAVAPLNILSEFCLPFVKKDGLFLAMKGSNFEKELAESQEIIGVLGGEILGVKKFFLPQDIFRAVILVKKIRHTPKKYPRNMSKISKRQ